MFNQDIKERYIASRSESMHNEYRNYFVASEPFEEQYGKDVACFTVEEIDQFLRRYGFSEPHTVRNRVAKLSSYAAWYGEQFGSVGNAFKGYDVARFPYAELMRPTLTFSPNELANKIIQVYDADSGQPAVAALCFAWLGLDSADIVTLRKEQVDTVCGKIFDATGGIIVGNMPRQIREILDIYGKTYSATRTPNQTFTVYAEDIGYFIKRMKTHSSEKAKGPFSNRQLASLVANMKDLYVEQFGEEAAIPLTYTNIQRSGGLYRLHEMEKSGIDIRNTKNADKVSLCLGATKKSHKDNMLLYDAYLECIGEK